MSIKRYSINWDKRRVEEDIHGEWMRAIDIPAISEIVRNSPDIDYDARTAPIRGNHVALTDTPPDPACRMPSIPVTVGPSVREMQSVARNCKCVWGLCDSTELCAARGLCRNRSS